MSAPNPLIPTIDSTLIPRFEFLKFAVISIASLHVDYIANPADFHVSGFP